MLPRCRLASTKPTCVSRELFSPTRIPISHASSVLGLAVREHPLASRTLIGQGKARSRRHSNCEPRWIVLKKGRAFVCLFICLRVYLFNVVFHRLLFAALLSHVQIKIRVYDIIHSFPSRPYWICINLWLTNLWKNDKIMHACSSSIPQNQM